MSTKTARKGTKTRKTRKSHQTELVAGPLTEAIKLTEVIRARPKWNEGFIVLDGGAFDDDFAEDWSDALTAEQWKLGERLLHEGFTLVVATGMQGALAVLCECMKRWKTALRATFDDGAGLYLVKAT
jgi:hypothetical protein